MKTWEELIATVGFKFTMYSINNLYVFATNPEGGGGGGGGGNTMLGGGEN